MSETTKILHRYTGEVLYEVEGSTREVVSAAVREGADLMDAYLQSADLRYANLKGANLQGANLRYANLKGADLQGAKFHGANLRRANLQGADLNWHSYTLLSEILWQAADTEPKKMLAAYIGREIDKCWDSWQKLDHPEAEWAWRELAKWVRPGDGAPEWIKSAVMEGPLQEDPALIIGRAILAQAPKRATGVYIHSREGISWGFRTNREKAPEGYVWLKPEEDDE